MFNIKIKLNLVSFFYIIFIILIKSVFAQINYDISIINSNLIVSNKSDIANEFRSFYNNEYLPTINDLLNSVSEISSSNYPYSEKIISSNISITFTTTNSTDEIADIIGSYNNSRFISGGGITFNFLPGTYNFTNKNILIQNNTGRGYIRITSLNQNGILGPYNTQDVIFVNSFTNNNYNIIQVDYNQIVVLVNNIAFNTGSRNGNTAIHCFGNIGNVIIYANYFYSPNNTTQTKGIVAYSTMINMQQYESRNYFYNLYLAYAIIGGKCFTIYDYSKTGVIYYCSTYRAGEIYVTYTNNISGIYQIGEGGFGIGHNGFRGGGI